MQKEIKRFLYDLIDEIKNFEDTDYISYCCDDCGMEQEIYIGDYYVKEYIIKIIQEKIRDIERSETIKAYNNHLNPKNYEYM